MRHQVSLVGAMDAAKEPLERRRAADRRAASAAAGAAPAPADGGASAPAFASASVMTAAAAAGAEEVSEEASLAAEGTRWRRFHDNPAAAELAVQVGR